MTMKIRSISRKIEVYLAIFWNKLNAVCILLFIIGCLLRFLPCHGCFCSARIVLAVALSLWYIRSLDVFSAVKILGPKLVMIGEMVKLDFLHFFPLFFSDQGLRSIVLHVNYHRVYLSIRCSDL